MHDFLRIKKEKMTKSYRMCLDNRGSVIYNIYIIFTRDYPSADCSFVDEYSVCRLKAK